MLRLSLLNALAGLLFFTASLLLWGGVYFHKQALSEYRRALESQREYAELTEQLVSVSEYLSDQARKFAITQTRQYMTNYWQEIEQKRTREQVLQQLEAHNTPVAEIRLLEQAKRGSDTLMATQIRSMRLVAESQNMSDLPAQVAGWQLSKEDQQRTPAQQAEQARMIVFDLQYDTDKMSIYTPIREFSRMVSQRTKAEVISAERQMNLASEVFQILTLLLPLLMGFIAWIQWQHLSRPIYRLLHQLQFRDPTHEDFSLNTVGVAELRSLANAFNEQLRTNQLQLKANQEQLSENHKLIAEMRRISKGLESHNWSMTGQNSLNEQLIRDWPLDELCRVALTFLLEYTGAHSGLFYIADQADETLSLYASIGCHHRERLLNQLKPGQTSLVSQAALEKKLLVLTENLAQHFPVHTNQPVHALLAAPFYYEQRLQGVLALAYSQAQETKIIHFLTQVSPTLGIAIHSRLATLTTRENV